MAARTLARAVNEAVAGMGWLNDTDQAAVALAVKYAREIDAGGDIRMIGPSLLGVLRDLGGTPTARRDLGIESQVKGRLAELRAARERRNAS